MVPIEFNWTSTSNYSLKFCLTFKQMLFEATQLYPVYMPLPSPRRPVRFKFVISQAFGLNFTAQNMQTF